MNAAPAPGSLIVIDDDPTGAQSEADVPLLLRWSAAAIRQQLAGEPRALHLLTNSRALDAGAAYEIVRDAAQAAWSAAPGCAMVLRGDSTLRAHLLPEYEAMRDVCWPGEAPGLLLVPALPSAGRVTVDGIHWLERDGARRSLEQTEFARDGAFAYETARLVHWARDRSGGYFRDSDAWEIPLEVLRDDGGSEAIAAALRMAGTGRTPGVVVPDAECEADLEVIAEGWGLAQASGARTVVRCAPALVGVLAGSTAREEVSLPSGDRVLVVVGSHVPSTTEQLAVLSARFPGTTVDVDPTELAGPDSQAAIAQAAGRALKLLADGGLAVVATSRAVADDVRGSEGGMRVARGLAATLAALKDVGATVVVSKGGITSAVNVRDGLGADAAHVVGPVAPGVALWAIPNGTGTRPVIVFPGNVGGPEALVDLVEALLES